MPSATATLFQSMPAGLILSLDGRPAGGLNEPEPGRCLKEMRRVRSLAIADGLGALRPSLRLSATATASFGFAAVGAPAAACSSLSSLSFICKFSSESRCEPPPFFLSEPPPLVPGRLPPGEGSAVPGREDGESAANGSVIGRGLQSVNVSRAPPKRGGILTQVPINSQATI